MRNRKTLELKRGQKRGAWLAQTVECATGDLRVARAPRWAQKFLLKGWWGQRNKTVHPCKCKKPVHRGKGIGGPCAIRRAN